MRGIGQTHECRHKRQLRRTHVLVEFLNISFDIVPICTRNVLRPMRELHSREMPRTLAGLSLIQRTRCLSRPSHFRPRLQET